MLKPFVDCVKIIKKVNKAVENLKYHADQAN